jgi:hypothetical protein
MAYRDLQIVIRGGKSVRNFGALLLVVMLALTGCATAVFDPSRPVVITPTLFGGGSALFRTYSQDGQRLSLGSLRRELKKNPEAKKHLSRRTPWFIPGMLFSGAGAGMMVGGFVSWAGHDKSIDTTLMAAGAGALVAGLVMEALADFEMRKAVEVHNRTLDGSPTGDAPAKP